MSLAEVYRDIPGYKGVYQVSNLGNIWSCNIMRKMKTGNVGGYATAGFYRNAHYKSFNVHRLVALEFVPNPENKPEVNHKDCDKLNNRADNLEWATRLENMRHAKEMGRIGKDKRNNIKQPTANLIFKFRSLELFTWLKGEADKKEQPLTSFINDMLDKVYYSRKTK